MKTKMQARHGVLYPILVLAAVIAIIFSVVGVATITGIFAPAQPNASQTRR